VKELANSFAVAAAVASRMPSVKAPYKLGEVIGGGSYGKVGRAGYVEISWAEY
jgi:hypothetical protein